MRSNIIIAGGIILFIVIMTTQRPFQMKAESWVTDQGIVTELYETGLKDFVVRLKDHAGTYYLDASTISGFSLEELRAKLMYKPVVIQYPERWTAKEVDKKFYISRLESNGELIYHDNR